VLAVYSQQYFPINVQCSSKHKKDSQGLIVH